MIGRVGHVAGGVHAVEPGHGAVLVDGDEAVGGVGQAGDARADRNRQRQDPVDVDAATADLDAVVDELGGGRADELDAFGRQQLGDRAAALGPEQLQRRLLGRHEREVDVVDARARDVAGRDDRQLVERQAPRRACRDDERDALRVAVLEVGDQPGQRLGSALRAERDRVVGDRLARGSDGDQQGVVRQRSRRRSW